MKEKLLKIYWDDLNQDKQINLRDSNPEYWDDFNKEFPIATFEIEEEEE